MAATAGFNATIEVSADDSTYNSIGIANQASGTLQRAMLEVTQFGDSAIDRIYGLKDTPISVSGHYDAADTGQAAINSANINGTQLYVRFLADGTNGFKVLCLVESVAISAGVSDTATFDISFQAIAAPTAI